MTKCIFGYLMLLSIAAFNLFSFLSGFQVNSLFFLLDLTVCSTDLIGFYFLKEFAAFIPHVTMNNSEYLGS